MKRIAIMCLLLTGCIAYWSQRSLEKDMDSWVGADQAKLVSEWGAPDLQSAQPDSTKVLTWVKHWTDTSGRTAAQRECRQSFVVSAAGKVLRWSLNGGCS